MKKNELVVKSHRLVEASYRLGLNEQRIILYAICRSREEQKGLFPNEPVVITAEAFAKQFPSIGKNHVYQQLKEAMDALYDRSVTFHETDEDTGHDEVSKTRWISKASYVDGAGRIKIVFTPDVIKHIHRLEVPFTSYHLDMVGNMTSAHAVRMYEFLTQYRGIGSRAIKLAVLREALQLAPNEYKLTADLTRKVLDIAVKQINDHSDLKVGYDTKKTGRAITDFAFKIREKDAKPKRNAPTDADARAKLEANGQQRIPVDELDDGEEF
jgi:plasmid replication initiation protein